MTSADVHAAGRRQRAHHEEQRVAGQEGRDHQAGLAEDDEEEQGVDPGPVLRHEGRQVVVEVDREIPQQGEKFHGRDCIAPV